MKPNLPIFTVLLLILGVACASPRLEPSRARSWINTKTASPDVDISGAWESTNAYMAGGWGYGTFVQKDSKITGTLGPYTIEGRAAGKQIYTIIFSSGRVYYTAILEITKDGALAGEAISGTLADSPEAINVEHAPIHLVRPQGHK